MSEKPITQRIKDRLAAYTAMLRDIDNQLERLDRMAVSYTHLRAHEDGLLSRMPSSA